jgi:hypothetical protein
VAGDWMMIDLELADKPEVHQIAARLDLEPDAVIGKLIRVWAWFDKQTTDGNAPSVTKALVDRLSGSLGFGNAMVEALWLEAHGSGLRMPKFDRWNGQSAKKRALSYRRQSRWRNANVDAPSVTKALPEKETKKDISPIPPSGSFLRFWAAWPKHPRKQSQGKCWTLWRRKDFDQVAQAIHAHVDALKASDDWRKEGGAYIPAPLVYLNQQRWEGAEVLTDDEPLKVAMP